MFCHKCGTKVADDAGFCPKCGEKLIRDGGISQAPIAPTSETLPTGSTSSSDQAGEGLHSTIGFFMKIGGISLGLVAIYGSISGYLVGSVNPIIVAIGLVLGVIGTAARVIDKLLRKSKMLAFVVVGVVAVAIIVIVIALLDGNGLSIGNDKYVQMVKGGTLNGYSQKTVGEAFDDFLDNPKWESGLSEDGERFVNVKGGILYFDKEAELAVQFIVDEKNEEFQYNACEINGTPQNNLVFWNLLETIYNDDLASATAAPQSTSNSDSSGNRIVIGETQSYDNEFGNMEVTLDYVEFTDRAKGGLFGSYESPEEDSIFLVAAFTLKNIGTKQGSLITAWNTVVYDGVYEYRYHSLDGGTLVEIDPLTAPTTGTITFMVPKTVAESDKSLVLNINDGAGEAVISYIIRPDASASGGNVPSGSNVFGNVLNEYMGYIKDATYINCAYAIYDIDGNGVDELLVRCEDMHDEITKLYTYVDGTTYEIGEFWSRKRLLLDEEGNFYIIGSNGASNTILELARISSNGTDLVTIETWEMDGSIFKHTSLSGTEAISENEYQAASDRFFNITTDFVDLLNWQPLSAVAGNGSESENSNQDELLYNTHDFIEEYSYDDAHNIAQSWLNAHPEMEAAISGGSKDLYQADGTTYYLFDLGEMYYANMLVNSETGEVSIMVNYDGENPYSEIESADDYYNRYFAAQSTSTGEIMFNDVPVNSFFEYSIDEVIDAYGSPLNYEDYDGGCYYYDGITFICDDFTGEILKMELDPSMCKVDGVTLNKSGNRL